VSAQLEIQQRLTCPSCWAVLQPDELLWVSGHPDLRGDEFLGEDALKRFMPSRFDVDGFALDVNGSRCQSLACPKCHLTIPRILVEFKPLFVSVLGAPSSGKSYFLASTIWQTRQRLRSFHVDFADADPVANQVISGYEQKLFLSEDPDQFVAIPKTELDGELYQMVNYGSHQELYARPFVFSVRPGRDHVHLSNVKSPRLSSRALCLYDNAGEHFQPKQEAEISPATDHLALSEALLFVFDPLQHPRFRERCRNHSADPQLSGSFQCHRQDEILLEAAKRIRQKANLAQHEPFAKPLIVVVNKSDVWAPLADEVLLTEKQPFRQTRSGSWAVDYAAIKSVSESVRELCEELSPELISACDSFCSDVIFVPVSPQGCSPERSDASVNLLGVRPRTLKPHWAEVPLLYAMSRAKCNLVPGGIPKGGAKAKRELPDEPDADLRVFKGA